MKNMYKIKGLAIIYEFPPMMSSESIVTFKYFKNSNIDYTILTIDSSNKSQGYFSDIDKKIVRFNKESFEEDVLNYLKDNNDFDFFMTRVMPEFGHSIGFEIKKLYPHMKWISSYSDTIMSQPYMKALRIKELRKGIFKYLSFIYKNKYYIKRIFLLKRQFKKLLKETDLLVLTNEYQKRFMLKTTKYDNKITLIPHSYEPSLYKMNNKYKVQGKFNITYTGSLDEVRNPSFFLESIIKMYKESLIENVVINFYGNVPDKYKNQVKDYPFIKFYNNVNYEESLAIIKQADLLLAIDSDLEKVVKEGVFLPAKLFDYLGSGNKIFALTIIPSPTSDLMQETENYCSSYDYKIFKVEMIKAVNEKKKTRVFEKYTSTSVARQFDSRILELFGGPDG